MWILSITPDWVIHALLAAGILGTVAGFVLGMIPFISKYIIPIRVISVIVLALALYLEGGLADNKIWEARVKEVEAKLAQAEATAAKETVKIVEKVVVKQQKAKENTVVVKEYIDREVVKYDTQCVVPPPFIKALNNAANPPHKEGDKK
jgi:uncharacterized membrane protein